MQKVISSMRDIVEFCKDRGELLVAKEEVDPVCEISAIQKSLEDGPALLF